MLPRGGILPPTIFSPEPDTDKSKTNNNSNLSTDKSNSNINLNTSLSKSNTNLSPSSGLSLSQIPLPILSTYDLLAGTVFAGTLERKTGYALTWKKVRKKYDFFFLTPLPMISPLHPFF